MIDLSSQTIMWTVEAILIGKISAAAFGGVGMAIQVVVVCFTILITFVVGSSLIVTRYLGAENRWEANHVLGQSLMIGIVLAFFFALVWYFGAPNIFRLIREASGEARAAGITYLRTIALFAPVIVTNFIAVGIIRGAGATFHSMLINVGLNVLNMLLAPILIFGWFGAPRLEVFGAALAVGIAHTAGFIATFYVLRSNKSVLFLSFKELTTPNWGTFKRLFNAGLPTTIEQLVWSIGLLVMTSYAAVVGIAVLAAHQVFLRIQAILSMVYTGFGLGAMSLMGQNLGAEKHHLAQRTAEMAAWVIFVCVLFIVALIILFAEHVVAIFTNDPQVVRLGSSVIKLFAIVQIPKAVDGVVMGNLRGAGDLKWLMWITICSVVLFEVVSNWAVVFIFELSLWGLWLIHILDETGRLIANYWRFKGGKWKFIDL